MERKQYRNVRRTLSPQDRARYKDLAARIDREDKEAILATTRQVKERHDMLRMAIGELKAERERTGMSLADVAERSGIDKAALSRLETSLNANPKIETLLKYARAMGVELRLTVGRP